MPGPRGLTFFAVSDPGPRGARGAQGIGRRGERGLAFSLCAEPGPRGARGPQGEEGTRGRRGVALESLAVPGPRGPRGAAGETGRQGHRGLALEGLGILGPKGLRGPRGPPGFLHGRPKSVLFIASELVLGIRGFPNVTANLADIWNRLNELAAALAAVAGFR